jgi:phosphatidylglycerol:prolipoprotein diacylglycerol transferase
MIYWNPSPIAFTIPFIHVPIYIYGICFVTGFMLGYLYLLRDIPRRFPSLSKEESKKLLDPLTWFVVLGTIIGARLGHVFLYDWGYYQNHLLEILNTRQGGLASHGGTIGVLLALALFYLTIFRKKVHEPFLSLVDLLTTPTALVACFIRIGNFFNQEIVGIPTHSSWGVLFAAPAEHVPIVLRHPVQLYEACAYLGVFVLTWGLERCYRVSKFPGLQTGLFFLGVFGSRFILEFWKETQVSSFDQIYLQAGQTLSIPFIIAGLVLIIWSGRKSCLDKINSNG